MLTFIINITTNQLIYTYLFCEKASILHLMSESMTPQPLALCSLAWQVRPPQLTKQPDNFLW